MLVFGFDIYSPQLEKVELEDEFFDRTWLSNSFSINQCWNYGFEDNHRPVFSKELDGKVLKEDPKKTLKYVPFAEFKQHVLSAVEEEEKDYKAYLKDVVRNIGESKRKKAHLEDLQKTAQTEIAFKEWQKQIDVLEELIANGKSLLESPDDEEFNEAQNIKKLLETMESYRNNGFVVIPYYEW